MKQVFNLDLLEGKGGFGESQTRHFIFILLLGGRKGSQSLYSRVLFYIIKKGLFISGKIKLKRKKRPVQTI
jgi:hypothetical protein